MISRKREAIERNLPACPHCGASAGKPCFGSSPSKTRRPHWLREEVAAGRPVLPQKKGRGMPFGFRVKPVEERTGDYLRWGGMPAHRRIVEQRIGMKLPATARIHHFDPSDKRSNNGPFVVCEDAAYHSLIERRQRALFACGNANWRKCRECGKYDDPNNMRIWPDTTRPNCEKVSHYRWAGECVNRGERCQIRRPHSKPALRRGQKRYHGQLAPAHRRGVAVGSGQHASPVSGQDLVMGKEKSVNPNEEQR